MLSDELLDKLQSYLNSPVRSCESIGGGCIANACRLETEEGTFFLKWSTRAVAKTFVSEAEGLRELKAANSPLFIPDVIAVEEGTEQIPGLLLMEWIESGEKGSRFWEDFGRGLAVLHRSTTDRYGFHHDNFIGHLPQRNDWEEDWPTFFIQHRIEPQVSMARDRGVWHRGWDPYLERLIQSIDQILPASPEPSILHGDLWSGNFMVTRSGKAALIDPAVYYGHREADLAMTELFGGFNDRFYQAYREAWPLDDGYEKRRDLYNLYHLINHLNHFGGSYAHSVSGIIKQFR